MTPKSSWSTMEISFHISHKGINSFAGETRPLLGGFKTSSQWFQAEIDEIIKRYRKRNRSGPGNYELMDDINQFTGEDHLAFEKILSDIKQFPSRMRAQHSHIDALAQYAHSAHAAIAFLNTQPCIESLPPDTRYVAIGLASRAVSSLLEIHVLLLHGYSAAARSRWRTLFEITVISRFIALGPRNTALQFREFRWIDYCRERRATGETNWTNDGPSPEQMKKRLERRFGKSYGRPYGWAAVTVKRRLNKQQATFADLITMAGMEVFRPKYQNSHHDVHGGDSLGLLGNITSADKPFIAASSFHGVSAAAVDATVIFSYAIDSILGMCVPHIEDRSFESVVTYTKILETDYIQLMTWDNFNHDEISFERYNDYIDLLLKGDINEIPPHPEMPANLS